MSQPDTNLKAYQRHRYTPHQSPKVEYMPPALNTHQHHPSTPERYGCAYHEGSPTLSREAQTRCLVLTDPGQQHQQRVTVDFILTVLTVSVPARARDSWRRLYRQEHGEQLSQLHNAILDNLVSSKITTPPTTDAQPTKGAQDITRPRESGPLVFTCFRWTCEYCWWRSDPQNPSEFYTAILFVTYFMSKSCPSEYCYCM